MMAPTQVLQVLLQHQLKLHSSAKDVAQPVQFHGGGGWMMAKRNCLKGILRAQQWYWDKLC